MIMLSPGWGRLVGGMSDPDKHGMDNIDKAAYHTQVAQVVAKEHHELEMWLDEMARKPTDEPVTYRELRRLCQSMMRVLLITENRERAELSHLEWLEGGISFDDD